MILTLSSHDQQRFRTHRNVSFTRAPRRLLAAVRGLEARAPAPARFVGGGPQGRALRRRLRRRSTITYSSLRSAREVGHVVLPPPLNCTNRLRLHDSKSAGARATKTTPAGGVTITKLSGRCSQSAGRTQLAARCRCARHGHQHPLGGQGLMVAPVGVHGLVDDLAVAARRLLGAGSVLAIITTRRPP